MPLVLVFLAFATATLLMVGMQTAFAGSAEQSGSDMPHIFSREE